MIDDDADVAAYIQAVAEDCGFEVQATHRAEEFMTAYDSFRPNVISLDLAIPGVDGIELLRYLADKACTARIFIASGFGGNILSAAERLGVARGLKMAGIIQKPMRPADLRKLFNDLQFEV
ncbi:MAG: response regulator [Alphaproteobacteria bacterium]